MKMPIASMQQEEANIPTGIGQDPEIVRRAAYHLSQHTLFRCYLDSLEIDCRGAMLVVHGKLPSFYLKQVLQTTLRDVSGVRQIDNQVNVTSSSGLSSTPGTH
jgi:hypothetical protein